VLPNKPNCLNRRKSAHCTPKLLLQKLKAFTFLRSFVFNVLLRKVPGLKYFALSMDCLCYPLQKEDKHIYLTGFTAHNSLTFCSIWVLFFVLWKTISTATFLWQFLLADCGCCSIKRMHYGHSWNTCMPSWHPLLYSNGCSQLKKNLMGRWPWILSSWEKKQNLNSAKVVGVLSVLAKVNLLKIDLARPNCING
jgi:hypothetical protein